MHDGSRMQIVYEGTQDRLARFQLALPPPGQFLHQMGQRQRLLILSFVQLVAQSLGLPQAFAALPLHQKTATHTP